MIRDVARHVSDDRSYVRRNGRTWRITNSGPATHDLYLSHAPHVTWLHWL